MLATCALRPPPVSEGAYFHAQLLRLWHLTHIHTTVLPFRAVDCMRDTPTFRAMSSTFRPASPCSRARSSALPSACDISLPLSFVRNHTQLCSERGDQVRAQRDGGSNLVPDHRLDFVTERIFEAFSVL